MALTEGDKNVATVLIVEDNKTEQQLLRTLLEERHYQVITADDGEEALRVIAQQRPELILLDVVLPRLNGFQVCRQLKSATETRDIKIVLVTSKVQDSDRYWGLKQGADAYLTKPFKNDELLGVVGRLV